MSRKRIFIVEDEAIVSMDLCDRLGSLGYEVVGAEPSGDYAISGVREENPDLVLMDIMIQGDIDGIETAARIHKFSDVPIIFVTANSDQATIARAKITAPFGYLTKPYEDRDLYTSIEMALHRSQLERELRASQSWFSTTLKSIGDGIIATDTFGQVSFMNEIAEKLTGWTASEAKGKPIAHVFNTVDQTGQCIPSPVQKVLETLKVAYLDDSTRLIRKNGEKIPIDDSAAPIIDDRGNLLGVVLAFRDITNRKQAEEKLEKYQLHLEELVWERTGDLQKAYKSLKREVDERLRMEEQQCALTERLHKAEKMESLGLLAAGVAHDLNNTLGPLVGYPELILRKLPADSPVRKMVERIGRSAEDAASVIQDLLTLARRGRYEMKPTNLNAVIESYFDNAGFIKLRHKRPEISLVKSLDENLPSINGSSPHLSKVVMNLIINAYDAMRETGQLTVSTGSGPLSMLESGFNNIAPGSYVHVRVSDSGCGIPKEEIDRIFEPYFSRKQMGSNGSGLGLSVVYGVVKDHNGFYDVTSEVGKGTTFVLYFPVSEISTIQPLNHLNLVEGHERILVVDDVEEQRDLAIEILSSLGYTVASAKNGREAVKLAEKQRFELIVLDMIMEPDFDGLETYRAILQINPRQKAIIVSGFSNSERIEQALGLGAGAYIKKPYTAATLSQTIRSELNKVGETVV